MNGFTPQPAHLLPAVPSSSYLYSTWYKMLGRCHNPSDPKFPYYGGRGIGVCQDWQGALGVRVFAAHVGERPGPKYTLGRIDNDRGYEPGNVRWETWNQQQNNRRSNVRVTANGRTLTLAQWAADTGIDRQLIQTRKVRGWAIEVAVVTPKGVRKEAAHEAAGIPPARATDRRLPWKRNRK